jgi:hypothetical protein
VRWAAFLAEDADQNYAPLVLGILESDNHNSSLGQQQIKKLHTI